jgi:long-chain acyl-CoA synthetase
MADVPSVTLIIYDGKPNAGIIDKIKALRNNIRVISLDEVKAMGKGKDESAFKDRLPTRDDIACIMYTSGSTGERYPPFVCASN